MLPIGWQSSNIDKEGAPKILFITGKGIHSNYESDPYASKNLRLLKHAIPEFIQNQYSKKIVSITTAPRNLGGEGAIIVFFKK